MNDIDTKALREKWGNEVTFIRLAEDTLALCDALDAARVELAESKRVSILGALSTGVAHGRAVAFEEAARLMDSRLRDSRNEPFRSSEIRALAPLESGLCVVSREKVLDKVEFVRAVLSGVRVSSAEDMDAIADALGNLDALEKEVGE